GSAADDLRAGRQSANRAGARSNGSALDPRPRRRGHRVKRRDLFTLIGAELIGRSLSAAAQQTAKIPRIGYLGLDLTVGDPRLREAFLDRLRDLGYAEGRNIV